MCMRLTVSWVYRAVPRMCLDACHSLCVCVACRGQVLSRGGTKDVIVHHPGVDLDKRGDNNRFRATLGAGRVSIPKRCVCGGSYP